MLLLLMIVESVVEEVNILGIEKCALLSNDDAGLTLSTNSFKLVAVIE